MESFSLVFTCLATFVSLLYSAYLHSQELARLQSRLQELEQLPPLPLKHAKTRHSSLPKMCRSLGVETKQVECRDQAVETELLLDGEKRCRDEHSSSEVKKRKSAVDRTRPELLIKMQTYNGQRAKERFASRLRDIAKKRGKGLTTESDSSETTVTEKPGNTGGETTVVSDTPAKPTNLIGLFQASLAPTPSFPQSSVPPQCGQPALQKNAPTLFSSPVPTGRTKRTKPVADSTVRSKPSEAPQFPSLFGPLPAEFSKPSPSQSPSFPVASQSSPRP